MAEGKGITRFVYSIVKLGLVSMRLFYWVCLYKVWFFFFGCSWSFGLRNTGEGLATRMESTKGKRGSKEYQDTNKT